MKLLEKQALTSKEDIRSQCWSIRELLSFKSPFAFAHRHPHHLFKNRQNAGYKEITGFHSLRRRLRQASEPGRRSWNIVRSSANSSKNEPVSWDDLSKPRLSYL